MFIGVDFLKTKNFVVSVFFPIENFLRRFTWSKGLKKTSKVWKSFDECKHPYELMISDVTSINNCQIGLNSVWLNGRKKPSIQIRLKKILGEITRNLYKAQNRFIEFIRSLFVRFFIICDLFVQLKKILKKRNEKFVSSSKIFD